MSKQTQKTVYFSRYTFEKLIIGPQILIAEFNIIFGVVAIIAAIPTGRASLYFLAVADLALGVSTIVVNVKKLNDLKNGNPNTNPTFLGMDQDLLDKLGITLMVVNLAMLAKHGLNKAADKLVNNQNNSALSDAWAAWKQQVSHVPTIPSRKTGPKIAPKTKPSKVELGGPGKNKPMDEFDDVSKGRTSTVNKVETLPKIEGTGNDAQTLRTGLEWDEYFRSRYGDQNVDWKTSSEYKLYGEKHIPYTPKIRPNAVITKPSLPKGGKPEGNYAPTKGKDVRGLKRQNEAANVLAENGYRTTMLDEVPNGNVFDGNGYGIDPSKSPDFIIEGQVFDCYAPNKGTSLENILNTLRGKTTKQARRIVLNLNDYPVEKRQELIDYLISQTHKDLKHLDELLIIEGRQVTRGYWRFD